MNEYLIISTDLTRFTKIYKVLNAMVNRVQIPSTRFMTIYNEKFYGLMRGLQERTHLLKEIIQDNTEILYFIILDQYKILYRKVCLVHCKLGIKLGYPEAEEGILEINLEQCQVRVIVLEFIEFVTERVIDHLHATP